MTHGKPVIFTSKRDAWIVILIWVGALAIAFGGIATLATVGTALAKLALAALYFAAAAFMFWVLYAISYAVDDEELLIRCGPFRYRVPLAQIDSVRPSRNPLSSPAASIDRLMIRWNSEKKRILISPEPRKKFLKELDARCDQLAADGDSLLRKSSTD